ncbi:MAG: succinate dehydrogenase/fumarate reductase cytochrome b subunit, partial [Bacteroidales bacterium]|nr:succinate dehydrogenase/fumarate reductase cytochrome b subunit [Bacteroidales bacterium]
MGNIFTSSIGKKLIMSISGLFLILFLLVHLLANSAYLFGPEAFDLIIEIMGSPVVVAMVPVLAFGFIIHIFYASYLTLTNMKARGKERYA